MKSSQGRSKTSKIVRKRLEKSFKEPCSEGTHKNPKKTKFPYKNKGLLQAPLADAMGHRSPNTQKPKNATLAWEPEPCYGP